tara:strand:- start:88 stop:711 length:624 start_codon:yes stop_codon:yes gene_type:complete
MDFSLFIFGLLTGLSFILAIGPQNLFVIEQGLKNQHVFLVCSICSLSDLFLIFLGIFLFHFLENFLNQTLENLLNIALILFLLNFIKGKLQEYKFIHSLNTNLNLYSLRSVILKVLGLTFLNPHVYSDTVFVLGNISKNFLVTQKFSFGIGASLSSFIFFFLIGYLSKYFSKYINRPHFWKYLNLFIILFMSLIIIFIIFDIIDTNF